VIRPLTLAVVADAAFSLVFLLGYATIGLVVTLRRPANQAGCRGRAHDGPQVSIVSNADMERGKCVAPSRFSALP
jgi:hypothetical protein